MGRFVIGISGASGVVVAHRLVIALATQGHQIDLILSRAGCLNAVEEMGKSFGTAQGFYNSFPEGLQSKITLYGINELTAPIASGSVYTDGMVVVPCSMATLSAMAVGLSDNLLRRAADVVLKERRRLIIVPRETPLSEIHLDNMLRLTRAGAIIFPPVPAWYARPASLEEMEDFLVGRLLDLLGTPGEYPRWRQPVVSQ